MLERRLELEGGLAVCPLGELEPEDGQLLECTLRLRRVVPGRRVALWLEALEGEEVLGWRALALPPRPGPEPEDVPLTLRLCIPGGGPRSLTIRADAHYTDQNGRCVL